MKGQAFWLHNIKHCSDYLQCNGGVASCAYRFNGTQKVCRVGNNCSLKRLLQVISLKSNFFSTLLMKVKKMWSFQAKHLLPRRNIASFVISKHVRSLFFMKFFE